MARTKSYLHNKMAYWMHLYLMRVQFDEMLTYKDLDPEAAVLIKQAKEAMIKAADAHY